MTNRWRAPDCEVVPVDSPFDLIQLYQFPPGRRELALSVLASRARERGREVIAQEAESAVAFERQAAEQRRQWLAWRARSMRASNRASELDPGVDRGVNAISSMAHNWARVMPAEHPKAVASQRVLAAAYPQGVSAITNQPYVEQLASVTTLLKLFETPAIKADIATIGATDLVAYLHTLVADYRTEVSTMAEQPPVSTDTVMANQAQGQRNLVLVLARLLGLAVDHADDATYLFAPVAEQQRALARQHRARSVVSDVNPSTGEEVADESVSVPS